ncbi:DUF6879 family protein [Actinomadura xylanilytica]|uniref:DUF6879 family protein n=1 Tax=Actinomadura xylanilytica TaxID=887459 RepID=UPI00255AEA51|nr:DUF6879 family protein [Actinomadura xylanilytica]MDL4770708.1 hypothetical protein [Actinomadura xylanilytica]
MTATEPRVRFLVEAPLRERTHAMDQNHIDPSEVDFVGGDPDSDKAECPAVWRTPGGLYVRGKAVADPGTTQRLSEDVGKGEDETDVWVPDRLFPAIREAIDDEYEQGREGAGPHDFAALAAAAERSVIRFECRDAYDVTEAARFEEWRESGDIAVVDHDLEEFGDIVREATRRGVRWRRVRIISRPMSEYMKWEHAVTHANIAVGEDIRWLWRDQAADLLVPAADCWVFDDRVIRWNFQRGDDSNPRVYSFNSDPRVARDIAGSFETAWNRATPHAEFKPE